MKDSYSLSGSAPAAGIIQPYQCPAITNSNTYMTYRYDASIFITDSNGYFYISLCSLASFLKQTIFQCNVYIISNNTCYQINVCTITKITPGNMTSGNPSLSTKTAFLLIKYGKSFLNCCKSPRMNFKAVDRRIPCFPPLALGPDFFICDKWSVPKSCS